MPMAAIIAGGKAMFFHSSFKSIALNVASPVREIGIWITRLADSDGTDHTFHIRSTRGNKPFWFALFSKIGSLYQPPKAHLGQPAWAAKGADIRALTPRGSALETRRNVGT